MLNELRYAWRQLRRTPGFTAVAVLTLALGIAASTTFFALIDGAVWRPLRALDIADKYDVYLVRPSVPRVPGGRPSFALSNTRILSMAQLDYLKSLPELGIVATAGAAVRQVTAQSSSDAGQLFIEITRGDFAGVTRMRPIAGRLTGLSNDGAQAGGQVVISERIWRSWFRSNPSVIGRDTIRINRQTFTIAGVADAGQWYRGSDLWMPLESWRAVEPDSGISKLGGKFGDQLDAMDFQARRALGSTFIRFRPGSRPDRLRPMIEHALGQGPTPPGEGFTIRMGVSVPSLAQPTITRMTWIVLGLALLVLFAACANLANMLQARATQRTGEVAVRLSLGASALNVFRLFLLEAVIISSLATAIGLSLAMAGLRAVADALPGFALGRLVIGLPTDISPDWRMLAYALGAGLFASLAVGGLTAWRISRAPLLRLFGASGIANVTEKRGRWTRTALVAVQVSAAVILLLGTGLYLVKAFRDTSAKPAFDTSTLASAQIQFDPAVFNNADVSYILPQIVASIERLQGIEAAAITDGMFGARGYALPRELFNLVAEDLNEPDTLSRSRLLTGLQAAVSPGFLDTLGLKVLTGRNLQHTDVAGAREVVLLSASAARTLWPGLDPLGRRVRLSGDKRWFTVVGTFEDPMAPGLAPSRVWSPSVALASYAQWNLRDWLVVLRSQAPGVAIQQVRPAVDAINPDVPVFDASIADRSIFAESNFASAFSGLVGTLGFVALAIAGLGVYGVISYSVSRRTREFGIRLALGATPTRIVRSVVDDAVHLVLVGLLPGVLLASWSTRMLEWQIVGLMPNDIPTWAVVPTLILAIGIFAAWIPARRASRVDPNVALRNL